MVPGLTNRLPRLASRVPSNPTSGVDLGTLHSPDLPKVSGEFPWTTFPASTLSQSLDGSRPRLPVLNDSKQTQKSMTIY